jgi:(E)-4-hydroxy-3-methylbut-2-enyl-diphosphate synthase
LEKTKHDHVGAMVESVLEHVRFFENMGFYNFKISTKASSVMDTINVYKSISEKTDYPLHLGVTEAGSNSKGPLSLQ